MTWQGTDPVKWAQEAIRMVKAVQPMFVEEMANSMATGLPSGGYTPIDTGNLSRSVTIAMTPISVDGPGYNSPVRQNYSTAVRAIPLDGTAFIAYKAEYAGAVNYGGIAGMRNRPGYAFLEGNIAKAPAILQKVVTRLKFRG